MDTNPFHKFQGILRVTVGDAHVRALEPAFVAGQHKGEGKQLVCRIDSLDPVVSQKNLSTHVVHVDNNANVAWNEDFEIAIDSAENGKLMFQIQDVSSPSHAILGVFILDIAALPVEKIVDQVVDLDRNLGKLKLTLLFNPMAVSAQEKSTRTRRITQLTLNLSKAEYMAHETVEGTVTLQLGSSFKFDAPIEVTFKGYEYVRWHEGEGDTRKLHSASSTVYQYVATIDQTRNVEVLAGENTWRFKIPLPSVMPPSLKTSYGKIEYYVEAKLHGHFTDRKYLTIWTPVRVSEKMKDRANEISLTKNNVKINAWTKERLLFVHEQPLVLSLHLEIDNASKRPLHDLQIQFIRRSKFKSSEEVLISQPAILYSKMAEDRIPAKSWFSQEFLIDLPEMYRQQSITSDIGAKLVSIKHWIVITLKKESAIGPAKKISAEIPIFIGERKTDHDKTKKLEESHPATEFRAEQSDAVKNVTLSNSLDKIHL